MKILLRWRNASDTATEHRIYRSTASMDPGNLPAVYATVGGTVNFYEDTSVVDATTYFYIVESVYGGSTVLSPEVSKTASSSDPLVANAVMEFDFANIVGGKLVDLINSYSFDFRGTVLPFVSGPKGLAFVGNDSGHFRTAASLTGLFTTEFTFSAYVKWPEDNGNIRIFDWDNNVSVLFFDNGIQFNNYITGVFDYILTADRLLETLAWFHLAITYDNGVFTTYLNGTPAGGFTITHSDYTASGQFTLAGRTNGTSQWAGGAEMCLPRLYNAALSQADVLRLSNERVKFAA